MPPIRRCNKEYSPDAYNRLTESELWMLHLGSPVEDQLDLMLGKVNSIPPSFQYHPFWSLIGKMELGSRNKRPLNRPRGLRTYVGASIWILALCKPHLWTTRDGIRGLTGLWPHGMVTLCIYWLSMKLQDTYGSSSQNPRSCLWTSSIHSWTIVAMN
jgi:hypothetical protein